MELDFQIIFFIQSNFLLALDGELYLLYSTGMYEVKFSSLHFIPSRLPAKLVCLSTPQCTDGNHPGFAKHPLLHPTKALQHFGGI